MKSCRYCFLTGKYILALAIFLSSWQFNNNNYSVNVRSLQAAPINKDKLTEDLRNAISDSNIEGVKKAIAQFPKSQLKSAEDYFHRAIVYYEQRKDNLARADWENAKKLFLAKDDMASVKEINSFLGSLSMVEYKFIELELNQQK